jgi:hypothetical protein
MIKLGLEATYATAALNGSTENAHIARNVADTGRFLHRISVGFIK